MRFFELQCGFAKDCRATKRVTKLSLKKSEMSPFRKWKIYRFFFQILSMFVLSCETCCYPHTFSDHLLADGCGKFILIYSAQ